MCALRGFLQRPPHRVWGRYGFVDAFSDERNWYARTYLAIDQGPIVAMIENYRSDLVWRTMRRNPYIVRGLRRAGFTGGWLAQAPQ